MCTVCCDAAKKISAQRGVLKVLHSSRGHGPGVQSRDSMQQRRSIKESEEGQNTAAEVAIPEFEGRCDAAAEVVDTESKRRCGAAVGLEVRVGCDAATNLNSRREKFNATADITEYVVYVMQQQRLRPRSPRRGVI